MKTKYVLAIATALILGNAAYASPGHAGAAQAQQKNPLLVAMGGQKQMQKADKHMSQMKRMKQMNMHQKKLGTKMGGKEGAVMGKGMKKGK